MSPVGPSHFVFVDFENVPDIDLGVIRGKPVHVTVLIGKNQRKIDLALVRQIQAFAAQVALVEVGASGHNALDIILACHLGRAIERAPGAKFAIVSKDKDFAPMIAHLRAEGIEVARHESFATLPFAPPQKSVSPPKSVAPKKTAPPAKKPAPDRRAKIVARLQNSAAPNRPGTEKALRAHLAAALGMEASETAVSDIVRELSGTGALTIGTNNKVTYR